MFKYKISLEKAGSHSGVLLSYLICGLGDRAQPQAGSVSPQAGSLGPQAGSLSPQAGSLGHFNPHGIRGEFWSFCPIPSNDAFPILMLNKLLILFCCVKCW